MHHRTAPFCTPFEPFVRQSNCPNLISTIRAGHCRDEIWTVGLPNGRSGCAQQLNDNVQTHRCLDFFPVCGNSNIYPCDITRNHAKLWTSETRPHSEHSQSCTRNKVRQRNSVHTASYASCNNSNNNDNNHRAVKNKGDISQG